MPAGDRRSEDETARLKREARHDRDEAYDDEYEGSHKRRPSWKDENRRQDRRAKKQRQRDPEWND